MTTYPTLLLATTLAISLTAGGAFAPPNANPSFIGAHCDRRAIAAAAAANGALRLSNKGDDGGGEFPSDRYSRAFEHNKARTSVRHLLTQRTIQSFLYLLQQCRDDHTVSWIEQFGDVGGLLTFHGTGAFNLTRFPKWDTFFLDMIDKPKESIAVRVKSRSGVNGGGRRQMGNPYFDAMSSTAKSDDEAKASSSEKKGSSPSTGGGGAKFGSYLDALSSNAPAKKTTPNDKKKKEAARKFGGMGGSYLDVLSSDGISPAAEKKPSAEKKKKSDKARKSPAGMSYLDALANEKPPKPSKKVYKPNKDDYAGERFVEISVDIDPPGLVNRMITVREQIAEEWVRDLGTLVKANNLILDNYYNNVRAARDLEEGQSKSKDDEREESKSKGKGKKGTKGLDVTATKGDDSNDDTPDTARSKGKKKAKSKDLDVVAAKDGNDSSDDKSIASAGKSDIGESSESPSKKELQSINYDGLSILDINAFHEVTASPLRKSNFDLLCLLVTQEAVHRLLREYQMHGDEKEVPFAFLKQFYIDRIDEVFDGSGPYGRHDNFVQGLLMASPTIVTTEDGKVGLNDPQRIAKKIIRMREVVANEWRDLMKDIPQQHLELRKALLGKQLEKSIFSEMKTVEAEEPKPTEVIEGGDFE